METGARGSFTGVGGSLGDNVLETESPGKWRVVDEGEV
jgi:hypothetical protein